MILFEVGVTEGEMIILDRFQQESDPCSYLSDRKSVIEYELVGKVSSLEYEHRMNRGWRKFGILLFHPVCQGCKECRPIRVPVKTFSPNRSQQRCLQKNRDLELRIGRPTADEERLALFDAYHHSQTSRKAWPEHSSDEESYRSSFLMSPIPAVEISAWEGKILRGVILVDITPRTLSAVYHYYDLSQPKRSLGTLLILAVINYAVTREKEWVYLGYFVKDCPSMAYKALFRPNEILCSDWTWRSGSGAGPASGGPAMADRG